MQSSLSKLPDGRRVIIVRAARKDQHKCTALFDAVSAHAPYSEVLAETLHPTSITAVLRATIPFTDGEP